MFNGGIRGRRAKDGQGTVSSQAQFVQQQDPAPSITGYSISGSDDTQLDPAGGQTVIVSGYGFKSGLTGIIGSTAISAVTVISATRVSFTSTAQSPGSYTLTLANSNGQAAILVPGLTYSSIPTFTTAAGSIGTSYETTAIDTEVVATSDSAITYTLASGSLPSGATLASDGTITGTSPVETGSTTYSFAITATDTELQDVTRSFTLTVNTDVVTWVTPSNGATIILDGTAYSQALSTTDAAGYSVSYTANALPTGLTLSTGTISGTPSSEGSTTTLLTATAATTGRSATNTVTWVVSLGDTYWKYVSLLLSGSTPTTTFINDASLNNAQLTIAGDTKPNNFNPYSQGYYSNYFNGSTYLTTSTISSAMIIGTSTFTVELWVYHNTSGGSEQYLDSATNGFSLSKNSSNQVVLSQSGVAVLLTTTGTVPINQWAHIAVVRNGTAVVIYINGVSAGTATLSTNFTNNDTTIGRQAGAATAYLSGYISNLRWVVGTAVYTSAFTTPTGPLTAIANTKLLTCQSNRFIDISSVNYSIINNSTTTISSAYPFTTPTTAAYNTQYSTTFDGDGDYLLISDNANLEIGAVDFTVEAWFNIKSLPSSGNFADIFTKGASGVYEPYYTFVNSSGSLLYYSSSAGASWDIASGVSFGTITPGIWYHVAVSRQGTNTRMFLNGALINTIANSGGALYNNSTAFGICGRSDGTETAFIGSISNVRLVNGTAVYTSAFTPPTSPLTAISNTQVLTCQDSTIKDNSPNNFTITSYGQARPIAVSPFTMTTSNTTVTSLGSAYFDGTGDYLTRSNVNFASNPFTIEGWFYPTTLDVGRNFWGMDNGSGTNPKILMYVDSSSRLTVDFGNAGTTQFPVAASLSTYGLTVNQWHHIAIVRSDLTSTGFKLYINGINAGTGQVGTNLSTITANFNIGYIGEAYGSPFVGYINDFRITNGSAIYTANFLPPQAPLTPVTNTSLLTLQYNGGATNNGFVDQSSFSNIVTRAGNATQGTFSPFSQNGWSNYFDGSSTYYFGSSVKLNPEAGAYTVEGWVNVPIGTNNKQFFVGSILIGTGGYSGSTVGALRMYDGSSTFVSNSSYLIATGSWNHFAIVREGTGSNQLKMYINGILVTVGTSTNSPGTATYNYIGSVNTSTDLLTGYISNLRFVKGTAVYTTASITIGTQIFTPPTSPLTAIANTQLLVCQSNRFIDNSPNNFIPTISATPSVQAYSPFGGVTSVPASYSNYFDGSSDYFTAPSGANLSGTGTSWTVQGWFYASTVGSTRPIITGASSSSSITVQLNGGYLEAYVNGNVMYTATTLAVNRWYHFAFVKNISDNNTVSLYLDGTRVGTPLTNFTASITAEVLYIGARTANLAYFSGYISNIQIVKGTALYTANFTVPTVPPTAVSGTSLLTCQSNTISDSSPNGFALTASGSPKVYTFNPFGTTTTTIISYTPAVNGGSIYFDGTGDYLSVIDNPSLEIGSSNFTLEGWFYWLGGLGNWTLFYKASSYELKSDTNRWVWQVNAASNVFITGFTPGAGQWYHVALVRNSTTTTLYLNGVSYTSGTSVNANDNTNPLLIGSGSTAFNGYSSDVRLTNGVALYTSNFYPGSAPATPTTTIGATTYSSSLLLNGTSGGIIDYHGTNNLETVGNTQLVSEDPYGGSYYSNYFDGTGDYLTVPASSAFALGTTSTIEFWLNPNTTQTTNARIFCQTNDTVSIDIYLSTTNQLSLHADSSSVAVALPSSTWTHVAVVYNSGTLNVYYNGVAQSVAGKTTGYNLTNSANVLYIGQYPGGGSYYYNGWLSNVRIVKGSALYTSNFTPSTTPLTAVSGTSLLTCQKNKFIDNSTNNFTITVNGDTKVKSMNPFQQNTGKSLYFDGSSGKLVIPASPQWILGTSDFTIEFWMYTADTAAGIITPATTGAGYWAILINASNLYWQSAYNGSNLKYAALSGYNNNQWVYVSIIRSSGTMNFYFNGVVQGSGTADTTNYSGATNTLTIGYDLAGNGYYSGYIKDLRITRGVARANAVPTTPLQTK